jgi:ATP-dependent DNA ligase
MTRKRTEPAFIEPMQCRPVTALPAGEKWTFEIKFDGYRCIAVKPSFHLLQDSLSQWLPLLIYY